MSATFRVGDRVKVVSYGSLGTESTNVGRTGTVSDTAVSYGPYLLVTMDDSVTDESFEADELELVEAAPVNVPADPDAEPQPYGMPSPEADALDRIAELVKDTDFTADEDDYGMDMGAAEAGGYAQAMRDVAAILRETGRL